MSAQSSETLVHQLSPIDHLSPRIHIPKLLYFATKSSPEDIYSTLSNALTKCLEALPILGGTVSLMRNATQTGTLAIQAPFSNVKDIFTSKDLRETYDFDDVKARNFPPDAVDGTLVSPDFAAHPSQVLLAQVNHIRGGFVLSCAIHHCVVDETGIFNIIKLWSSFCSGEDGAAIISPAWMDRSALSKGRGMGRLEDHPEYKLSAPEASATHSKKNKEYISKTSDSTGSAILFFSDEKLKQLKADVTRDVEGEIETSNEASWISTNDALCALMWSRVTVARDLASDVPYSMFNMTVNGRSRIQPSLPSDSIGNAVFVSKAFQLPNTLKSSSLAAVALTIRKSILEINDSLIRDKIMAVMAVDDIGRLAPGGYSSAGQHVGCTSWSEQPYYTLKWGETLGGSIQRLRWRSNISDGIFVIFPRLEGSETCESGLEIYLGLQQDQLEKLRQDEVFAKYGEWKCMTRGKP